MIRPLNPLSKIRNLELRTKMPTMDELLGEGRKLKIPSSSYGDKECIICILRFPSGYSQLLSLELIGRSRNLEKMYSSVTLEVE